MSADTLEPPVAAQSHAPSVVDGAIAIYNLGLSAVGYGSFMYFLATTPEISPVKRIFAACAVGYVTRLCADFAGAVGMVSGLAGGGLLGAATGAGCRAARRKPETPGALGDVKTGAIVGIFGGLLAGTCGGFAGGAWGGYHVAKEAAVHTLAAQPRGSTAPAGTQLHSRQQLIFESGLGATVRLLPD